MPHWFSLLTQFCVIAFALLGGVFLAFSDFIMRSLGRVDGGAEVMQAINEDVFRVVFMTLFIGMVPASLGMAAGAWWYVETPWPFFVASALYIFGVFGVTARFNVPMNNALARMCANSAEGEVYWREKYLPRWTAYNTVRTAACVLAASFALIGLSG